MGLKENIAAVRGDAGTHAQNFFIYFFKKFPQHQAHFPDYKGKSPDSLKSVGKFAGHTTKVVGLLLEVVERSGDAGALSADAKKLAKMPQHTKLGIQEFKDLFAALVPFLQDTLGGSFDQGAWEGALSAITGALAGEL